MKFIYCFDQKLKDELLQNGFKLLSENSNFFIFENKTNSQFAFSNYSKKQFTFSDKLIF